MVFRAMTAVRVLEPGSEWAEALRRLGQDDVYFDHRYAALYAPPGARSEALVFEAGERIFFLNYIAAPIPGAEGLFDFETPYGYGGPLSSSDDPAFLAEAWSALAASCRARGIVAGFLRFHPLLGNQRLALPPAESRANRDTVVLGLAVDEAAALAGYSADARANVRKALKLGVEIDWSEEPSRLEEFAALYARRMAEVEAAEEYRFGEGYFQDLARLGAGRWRVYRARHEGRTIGGAIVLLSSRWAHYHLSASPREFQKLAPNHALRHGVVVSLLGRRDAVLFGGGKTSSPADPLLKFKAGFSRERRPWHTGRLVADAPAYARLCSDWERANPERAAAMSHIALRYRL